MLQKKSRYAVLVVMLVMMVVVATKNILEKKDMMEPAEYFLPSLKIKIIVQQHVCSLCTASCALLGSSLCVSFLLL